MLEAVETAAVVVSAVNGVEPVTQRMMDFARDRELCRLVIINKIDAKDAAARGGAGAVARDCSAANCLPLNLPGPGRQDRWWTAFSIRGPMPSRRRTSPRSKTAHTEIIDQVVEVDEDLMALYLEQGEELSPEQLHDPFERALREGHLVPVCFTSAEIGVGIKELLNIFARLMPNPLEGNPPPFLRGENGSTERVKVQADPSQHVIAHVFKVNIDPLVGRLGIFRVHQGTVRSGGQLFIGDARKPVQGRALVSSAGQGSCRSAAGDSGRHLRRAQG